jgi:hypothetical protein
MATWLDLIRGGALVGLARREPGRPTAIGEMTGRRDGRQGIELVVALLLASTVLAAVERADE